jgi:hypothetical protein
MTDNLPPWVDLNEATYIPTAAEAERDIHERSACTYARPCPACERAR